jgi:hypothetical protein
MTRLPRALTSGIAGALTLTALHEFGRRRLDYAPRMDVLARRGLRQLLTGPHDQGQLQQLALAGDLVGNSLYYASIAAPTAGATWMRAAVLGAAAGVGALTLPRQVGLGDPPHAEQRANQVLTIAYYVAGAVAAAAVANLLMGGSRRTRTRNR